MEIRGPSLHRMNMHAIEVLDAARAEAQFEPIKPGPAVRLALSWLTLNNVADYFETLRFWEGLTKPGDVFVGLKYREMNLNKPIERWKRVIKTGSS